MTATAPEILDSKKIFYNRFLLLVAGLGGLLYGVDVGIISGALPYLEATSKFSAGELSMVVAAVLLGSVISTLFAGLLADWMGRKNLMALSGVMFVISIPMIALSQGYGMLIFGRLLQGVSGGFIGVVVPLYLAECLVASDRGKGTGIFQWLLTAGICAAAIVGFYFSLRVEQVARLADAAQLFTFKDHAWRGIFWVSLPPGVLFVIGSFMVAESPRWLLRRGKRDAAYAALLRSRTSAQADLELKEMIETVATEKSRSSAKSNESLLRRKYVIPFILACVILACNQLTGINSIIAYNTTILLQSGLSDYSAHLGYVLFTLVNFLVTFGGVMLVDRKGPQIPAWRRHRWHHYFARVHWPDLHAHRKSARRRERRRAGDGDCRSETSPSVQRRCCRKTYERQDSFGAGLVTGRDLFLWGFSRCQPGRGF